MTPPLARPPRSLMASRAGRWIFAGLAALGLAILILGRIDHPAIAEARSHVLDLASPLLDVLARPIARIDAGLEWVGSLGELAEENARLRAENRRLRRWQSTSLALERENDRLRGLLNAPGLDVEPITTARVIGVPGGPFVRSVILAAGREHGVRDNQPVLVPGGLVGRVLEAGERASRVLLITDLNSRVPVRLENSETTAIARGRNDALLELAFLDPEVQVSTGEHVFTTGDGGIFPPDVLVGRVAEAGERVTVRPAALLERLNFVQVVPAVKDLLQIENADEPSGSGDSDNAPPNELQSQPEAQP